MKRAIICFVILIFVAGASFYAGLNAEISSVLLSGGDMSEEEKQFGGFGAVPPGNEIFSKHDREKGVDLGGVHHQQGLTIHWAGSDPLDERVRPVDVLKATSGRLQMEQLTDLGSDANARALIKVMEAIAELDGDTQETPDGPVIR